MKKEQIMIETLYHVKKTDVKVWEQELQSKLNFETMQDKNIESQNAAAQMNQNFQSLANQNIS